jgi:hypothetical protein
VEATYDKAFNNDRKRTAHLFELYRKLDGNLFAGLKKGRREAELVAAKNKDIFKYFDERCRFDRQLQHRRIWQTLARG